MARDGARRESARSVVGRGWPGYPKPRGMSRTISDPVLIIGFLRLETQGADDDLSEMSPHAESEVWHDGAGQGAAVPLQELSGDLFPSPPSSAGEPYDPARTRGGRADAYAGRSEPPCHRAVDRPGQEHAASLESPGRH